MTRLRFGSVEPASAPARLVTRETEAELGGHVHLSIPGKQTSCAALQPSSPVVGLPAVSLDQYLAKVKGESVLQPQDRPSEGAPHCLPADAVVDVEVLSPVGVTDQEGVIQGVNTRSVEEVIAFGGIPDPLTSGRRSSQRIQD